MDMFAEARFWLGDDIYYQDPVTTKSVSVLLLDVSLAGEATDQT